MPNRLEKLLFEGKKKKNYIGNGKHVEMDYCEEI